jgi:hypothetical protein
LAVLSLGSGGTVNERRYPAAEITSSNPLSFTTKSAQIVVISCAAE